MQLFLKNSKILITSGDCWNAFKKYGQYHDDKWDTWEISINPSITIPDLEAEIFKTIMKSVSEDYVSEKVQRIVEKTTFRVDDDALNSIQVTDSRFKKFLKNQYTDIKGLSQEYLWSEVINK